MTSELNWDIFIKNWDLLNNNKTISSEKEKAIKIKDKDSNFDHKNYIEDLKRKNQISVTEVEIKNNAMIDTILKQQKNKKNKRISNSSRTLEKTKKDVADLESLN